MTELKIEESGSKFSSELNNRISDSIRVQTREIEELRMSCIEMDRKAKVLTKSFESTKLKTREDVDHLSKVVQNQIKSGSVAME